MSARAAAVLVAVLALAGCAGIPSSGSVEPGAIIDEAEALINVAFNPLGPQDGATQNEILLGFIDAATNPQNDFDVARSFLSDGFREEWDPDAITQIRSGRGTVRDGSETSLSYALTGIAHVNEIGQYIEDTPATQVLDFTFEQDAAGEWRIASAPPGIVLSRESFTAIFVSTPLYFFDPSNAYLIPDLRWFAKRAGLTTDVVRELVRGQSAWLQQGVTNTYFPEGTTLESSVAVEAGVATVALSDEALDASPDEIALMRQQLRATIGSVSSVVITANSVTLPEQDGGPALATSGLAVESQSLAAQDDVFGYLKSNGSVEALSGLSAEVTALGATDATLLRNKSAAAVQAPDGAWLVPATNDDPVQLDRRPGLLAPTADNAGFVWTVPASDAAAIIAYDATGKAFAVTSPQFSGMQAVSFAISRDGARALMLVNTELGPRLFVSGIIRTEGVPIQLGTPVALPIEQSSTAIDATWVDDNTVAVLRAVAGDDQTSVSAYELGGASRSLGRLADGVAIVGGNNGSDGLRVLTADGDVFQPRGNGWADTDATVLFLATQQ